MNHHITQNDNGINITVSRHDTVTVSLETSPNYYRWVCVHGREHLFNEDSRRNKLSHYGCYNKFEYKAANAIVMFEYRSFLTPPLPVADRFSFRMILDEPQPL